uniref:ARAD1D12782p n=1 Tax=Blastobotrys adeninivorans TaxID=409370 RepID=A0A060T947_BLAAD
MRTISLPPLTRAVVAVYLFLNAVCGMLRYASYSQLVAQGGETAPRFVEIVVPYLTLVPSLSITFPWVVVTSSFIEQSIVGFVITGAFLSMGTRYCERAWGSKDMAVYLAIQSIIPNIVTTFALYVLFAATRDESVLLTQVGGGIGFQMGFLVAFKQLVPEHAIVLLHGAVRIPVKYLTVPIMLIYTVVGLIMRNPALVVLTWSSFFTAWIYLRFYKVTYVDSLLPTSDNLIAGANQVRIRGDASDMFALARFFYPKGVQKAVEAVSNPVFDLLVAAKLCAPFSQDEIDAGNMRNSQQDRRGSSRTRPDEADRRRALALKALEERLGSQETTN